LDEIGLAVYEEMLFKVKVYGRTTDGRKAITKDHHVTLRQLGELKINILIFKVKIVQESMSF
jgi:hypothetical protein